MSFSLVPLLLHSSDLPEGARAQLAAALATDEDRRDEHLLSAARLLHRHLDLDCDDARELVGLPPPTDDCGCA
ncbi:MAG: hypothetical protein KF773_04975 [Deltaproteobacteria bacterium]|nr:hypothetical protein [Deltaproteobacteria bacterium]MCW5802129.1 hypothetical protein [Deltaproteobacteria bacterium]